MKFSEAYQLTIIENYSEGVVMWYFHHGLLDCSLVGLSIKKLIWQFDRLNFYQNEYLLIFSHAIGLGYENNQNAKKKKKRTKRNGQKEPISVAFDIFRLIDMTFWLKMTTLLNLGVKFWL